MSIGARSGCAMASVRPSWSWGAASARVGAGPDVPGDSLIGDGICAVACGPYARPPIMLKTRTHRTCFRAFISHPRWKCGLTDKVLLQPFNESERQRAIPRLAAATAVRLWAGPVPTTRRRPIDRPETEAAWDQPREQECE